MILTIKQAERIELAFTVLLAALPSLYLLFNYPPFFNSSDSIFYLTFPYSGVPHYPMFYPMYCSCMLKLVGDGIGFVYAIILGQHIFYTLGVLYIAFYMTGFKRRMLFLCCMFFAFRATIYIHGMYTEAPAIIAVGFMVGALLRICTGAGNRFHYGIYAGAAVILLLSRFAGMFLIFVLPLWAFLTGMYQGNLLHRKTLKTLLLQTLLPAAIYATAQLLTLPELIFVHAPDSSLYGLPGCNSVSDAMDTGCTYMQPGVVITSYKNSTNDTLVKRTFDIIKTCNPGDIWGGVRVRIDSLRTDFINQGIVSNPYTADGCLNAAFRIYLAHPCYYPYKRILPDLTDYFCMTRLTGVLSNDCNYLLTLNSKSLPSNAPLMKKYMENHFQVSDYNKLTTDNIINEKAMYLTIPLLLVIILLLKRKLALPVELWMLFTSVTISVCFCHIITAIITTKIMRYIQPAEFMLFAMWCAVIAAGWPFNSTGRPVEQQMN